MADYNARRRELYAKNREKVNARRRELYVQNRDKVNARRRELYTENCEKVKANRRKHYAENRSGIRDKKAAYRAKIAESINSYLREYRKTNKPYLTEYNRLYMRKRIKKDICFKLRVRLRTRIYLALKGVWKSAKTAELLGCSIDFLMRHIESQFKPDMSWGNYGKWHVDHIRPCASFDLSDPEQQRQCFHYSNLQPLWAEENFAKRAKVD